jgi:hypothetical protein
MAPRSAAPPRRLRAPAPLLRRLLALAAALALAARGAHAQTYTNENIPGVTAYSAFQGSPSAGAYRPYSYSAPPADLSRCGGTCIPVAIAGSPSAGYWLTRGGQPYWIKCVACARAFARGARRPIQLRARAPRAPPASAGRAADGCGA